MPTLLPELLYHDGAFHRDRAVTWDAETGVITAVTAASHAPGGKLPGVALMPGFVNTHSHAFQRVIRGRTQWRPDDERVSDFWSWRDAMYHAALSLSPDDIHAVSRFCFIEMLRAGITTVGEFHYLQNDPDGRGYDEPAELAMRVVAAARGAGMRIALLNVCYATGAIGEPLRAEQRRFATADPDAFLGMTAAIAAAHRDDPLVSVGVAPHSVRAVPREWLQPLHAWAATRALPFHMHVGEQPAEVEACVAAYGARPVELLDALGLLDERFTAVHATHITDQEVARLADSGATVCACPGTERDLGDGFLRAVDLVRAGGRIALGSDSQTIIDMFEEMRLVEYHERLRRLERVVVTRAERGAVRREPAPLLLEMASAAGARSLRSGSGVLEAGAPADFIAIDLEHPALAGWSVASLAASLVFSAPAAVVRDVWVGGRHVVKDRVHPGQEEAMHDFNAVSRTLTDSL